MKHVSVVVPNTVELINIEPTKISPLLSKCQIKVCYVGDEPNRNKSIITKEVATKMAPTLRGCPIVGYYNDTKEDYEEHNKIIDLSNGNFEIKETTKPCGFVDINAKVWFQKFLDDGIEHEYLMTEGFIWTGQYPESQRIIDKGNNQSMELDEKTLEAYWTKDKNDNYQFFIINEAIMSKLCVLGEDVEPCFEGSTITGVQFSFDDNFRETLFSFAEKMKEIITGGETPMYTTYAVDIGSTLWDNIYNYIRINFPGVDEWYSKYSIEGVYEESNQKFVILQDNSTSKYYRMNFSINENDGFIPEKMLIEVTKSYSPLEVAQFSAEAVEEYVRKKKTECAKEDEDKKKKDKKALEDENKEDPSKDEEPKNEDKDEEEDPKKKKKKYNLDEVEEYIELTSKYNDLETNFNNLTQEVNSYKQTIENLNSTINELKEQNTSLSNFKLSIERKDKEDMIYNTFFMLDDNAKEDVIKNIDTYSLDDIEAKLSVICVRNKVSFDLEPKNTQPTTYSLNDGYDDSADLPAWVQAARSVEKSMNK